uniref:Uncharacterized protein n=1 Tax=Arundo donax TaxID=35708 RepID=A0A0A9AGT2_ARUDO
MDLRLLVSVATHSRSNRAATTAMPLRSGKPSSITELAFAALMPPMATTGNFEAKHMVFKPSNPKVGLFAFVVVGKTPPQPM